jgi:hypothetical protein
LGADFLKALMSFFKLDDEILLEAPTTVMGLDYDLYAESHTEYEYPIEGWYWFDSELEAREFFGLPIDPVEM